MIKVHLKKKIKTWHFVKEIQLEMDQLWTRLNVRILKKCNKSHALINGYFYYMIKIQNYLFIQALQIQFWWNNSAFNLQRVILPLNFCTSWNFIKRITKLLYHQTYRFKKINILFATWCKMRRILWVKGCKVLKNKSLHLFYKIW